MFILLAHKGSEDAANASCERLSKEFPDRKFTTKPAGAGRFDVGLDEEPPVTEVDLGRMRPVAAE